MTENLINKIRSKCWDNAVQAFGYSYIFACRARFYSKWSKFMTTLGIIVPLIIGATASGYGIDSSILKLFIFLSIPLSILQVILSAIAIVNNWEDKLSYSFEALSDYDIISEEYKELAKFPPEDNSNLLAKVETLDNRMKFRSQNDAKHLITDLEKRKGMRWALREFKRSCVGCDEVPISMESTDCPVCGKYKKNFITKLIYHG